MTILFQHLGGQRDVAGDDDIPGLHLLCNVIIGHIETVADLLGRNIR